MVNHHETHHLEKYVLLVPGILSKSKNMGGGNLKKTTFGARILLLKKIGA